MNFPLVLAAALVTLPATRYVRTDQSTTIPVTVRLASFAIGVTEVTQAEFEAVTGFNPSVRQGADLPVHNITWWDAIRYANALSAREGLDPAYDLATGACDPSCNGYRLPTDAEWSYAAGEPPAKNTTPAPNLGPSQTADAAALLEWARTHGPVAVSALPADARGLRGLFGNVWEWVSSLYRPYPYRAGDGREALDDAASPRVFRGGLGSYIDYGTSAATRFQAPPDSRDWFRGFRCARDADG